MGSSSTPTKDSARVPSVMERACRITDDETEMSVEPSSRKLTQRDYKMSSISFFRVEEAIL